MTPEERKLAADVLNGLAGGLTGIGSTVPDATTAGITTGVGGVLKIVAALVSQVGTEHAIHILNNVVDNPARALSNADLDDDVRAVLDELGLDGEHPVDELDS